MPGQSQNDQLVILNFFLTYKTILHITESPIFDQPFSQKKYNNVPKVIKTICTNSSGKKELIKDTALELFAENGFHATSISQIAKKAGISKGLTYNYFESKNDILEEITDQGFQEIHDLLDPNKDGILTEEEFISFIEGSFNLVKNNHRHWKLFFSLMIQPAASENFTAKYAKIGEPMFRMMYDFFASKGSSDPEGDLMIISAMIEGAFLYAIVAPEIFPIEKMKEKVIDGIYRIIK